MSSPTSGSFLVKIHFPGVLLEDVFAVPTSGLIA